VRLGEADVHGRLAAAQLGGVHEVVVHECAGLDQLERADRGEHGLGPWPAALTARRPPAPPGEGGPDALAAPQREVGQRVHRGGERLRQLRQLRAPRREIAPEHDLDVLVHGCVDVAVDLQGHVPILRVQAAPGVGGVDLRTCIAWVTTLGS
jgi:hypothetical protein